MSERKEKESLDNRKGGVEAKENESLNWKREPIGRVKIFVAAAATAFLLNSCIIANSEVPSGSMEQMIMTEDHITESRLAYRSGNEPEWGDIVVFKHKSEPGKDKARLIKRIIGLLGETVNIRDNHVYINRLETSLKESYLPEPMESDDYHFEIPEGCYPVPGDNRSHSVSVRRWSDPCMPKEEILTKVLIKYFPEIKRIR